MTDEYVTHREADQRFESLDQRFRDLESHRRELAETIEGHRIELRDLLKDALNAVSTALEEYKKAANEWRQTLNDVIANRADKAGLTALSSKFELAMSTQLHTIEALIGNVTASIEKINQERWIQAGAKEQVTDDSRRSVERQTFIFGLAVAAGAVAGIVALIVKFF